MRVEAAKVAKIVRTWPAWKQNLLENSFKSTNNYCRIPIRKFTQSQKVDKMSLDCTSIALEYDELLQELHDLQNDLSLLLSLYMFLQDARKQWQLKLIEMLTVDPDDRDEAWFREVDSITATLTDLNGRIETALADMNAKREEVEAKAAEVDQKQQELTNCLAGS